MIKGLEVMPRMRLDFIFASPDLLLNVEGDSSSKKKDHNSRLSENRLVAAGIERSNITDELSDHYPVFFSWVDPHDPFALP